MCSQRSRTFRNSTREKVDLLSHCLMGTLHVQANILQPLTHVGTLNLRYEAVEELVTSDEMLVDLAQALASLPRDLDKVCRGLVSTQLHPYPHHQSSA